MKGVTVTRLERRQILEPRTRGFMCKSMERYVGHLPAEIRIVPDALTLLVPEDYGR